jgi:RNA polymerase sigma-70 factor (ECF subfamily)
LKSTKKETDERLLIEAAQKDPECFADLYEAHFHRVYAYVVSRIHNRDEAQDITADVFHQALANLANYEWRGIPFAAWLYRIASNEITDRWERSTKELGNPAPEYSHEVNIEEIEQRATLFRIVSTLPVDQRHVILQRFVEQKSIREIAKELQRSEGAVKQLQFRALQNLRMRMGETNG